VFLQQQRVSATYGSMLFNHPTRVPSKKILHWAHFCWCAQKIAQPCRRTTQWSVLSGAIYIQYQILNVASAREWDFTAQMFWWYCAVARLRVNIARHMSMLVFFHLYVCSLLVSRMLKCTALRVGVKTLYSTRQKFRSHVVDALMNAVPRNRVIYVAQECDYCMYFCLKSNLSLNLTLSRVLFRASMWRSSNSLHSLMVVTCVSQMSLEKEEQERKELLKMVSEDKGPESLSRSNSGTSFTRNASSVSLKKEKDDDTASVSSLSSLVSVCVQRK